MKRLKGYYSLIQFCPKPERLEYVNVGVLLSVPETGYWNIKYSSSPNRVQKLFGRQNDAHYKMVLNVFNERLKYEFSQFIDNDAFELFAHKRANELRLTELKPISVISEKECLFELFEELVGEEEKIKRAKSARIKLKNAFEKANVMQWLDKPEVISLPGGIEVSAPYGYQNGSYNLIDSIRLDQNKMMEALKEAGRCELEGKLLKKHFEKPNELKTLIVVGDFKNQSDDFYREIKDIVRNNVRLYRLDNLNPLLNDIEQNSIFHSDKNNTSH